MRPLRTKKDAGEVATKSWFLLLTLCCCLVDTSALAQICATPGQDGNITGVNALGIGGTTVVVNTYYPGTADVAEGSMSLPVGSSRGADTAIQAGDLLLVIQIQDSIFLSTDTNAYGDGTPGGTASGALSDRNTGLHEYVQATGPISGGFIPIQGATVGSGLLNAYSHMDATSTQGQRRFQVIRVPQFNHCEIAGTVVSAPWDGSTGGIVAIDVEGTLTFLPGSKVNVSGQGFRGGAGRVLRGGPTDTITSYRRNSSNKFHGSKAEGTAGTPRFIHQTFTGSEPEGQVIDTGFEGYPDGSLGRGAPGNAGGGGNDGRTTSNGNNSGGGGGGNGGIGGKGGNTWGSNLPLGGFGGDAFAASIQRLTFGGGGGAGTNNDGQGAESSGGAGGGIVLIRASTITGSGVIEANGMEPNEASNLFPGRDAGGGGGAGGTLVIFGNAGSLGNITLFANGGKGSDCALRSSAHGPGGGGGGGIVYVNGLPTGNVSVSGGTNGVTTAETIAYGATSGSDGAAFLDADISSLQTCGFVPVSLSYFKASSQKDDMIQFEWMTVTETGNLGFYLLGFDGRNWKRIHQNLILSQAMDSDEPLFYQFKAKASHYHSFALEDMDRFGNKKAPRSFRT